MNTNYEEIKKYCDDRGVTLVAVSKTKTPEEILSIYNKGQRIFGENKVQELVSKVALLPDDVQWHLIGHLQSNKVKQVLPFVSLIHSIDSEKLLFEIHKQAEKISRTIDVLLQIHIAEEETKFGLSYDEARSIFQNPELKRLSNVHICGLMGMATLTENESQIRKEFRGLKNFYNQIKSEIGNPKYEILSMGMSSDYKIAIEEGSNMVRIGTAIFGERAQ